MSIDIPQKCPTGTTRQSFLIAVSLKILGIFFFSSLVKISKNNLGL